MPDTFKLPTNVNTPFTLNTDSYISPSFIFYIIVVLLLAFLGFNLFRYLADFTDKTNDFLSIFGRFGENTIRQTADVSAKGAKSIVNVTADTLDDTLSVLESKPQQSRPKPDYSDSTIQQRKPGYCYVGTDKGFRTCVHVSRNQKCMSGQIFPTKAVCINPNLRD